MTASRRGPSTRLDDFLQIWAVPRQFAGADHKGAAARSELSEGLRPRLAQADRVGVSVCPYCAVGCSTLMYARQGRLVHVEGNPDSPVNAGTLCPKGATLFSLHANPNRLTCVKYRAPYRSDKRRVGKECVSPCKSRWAPDQ